MLVAPHPALPPAEAACSCRPQLQTLNPIRLDDDVTMAATTDSSPWVEEAFRRVKEEFLKSLTNESSFDFSKISSANDVLDAALAIQKKQATTKTFRGLGRIKPLIDVLKDFSSVIDTFVQVKPDILGLIWVRTGLPLTT